MRHIRNTYDDEASRPVLTIHSETGFYGSPLVLVNRFGAVMARRTGEDAVVLLREYARLEYPNHECRG